MWPYIGRGFKVSGPGPGWEKRRDLLLFLKGLRLARLVIGEECDGEAFGFRGRNISGISSPAIKNIKFAKFLCADIVLSALHVPFYLI